MSSHSIGSRNLNAAVVTAPGKLVVPSQDHRTVLARNCPAACQVTGKLTLGGAYTSHLLFSGGQVWVGDNSGKLHGWKVIDGTDHPSREKTQAGTEKRRV